MSYRHPNEMAENKKMLEECMHDAVKCGLNEVMPEIMSEFESVISDKMDAIKNEMIKVEDPKPDKTFNQGVWMGLAIGACLFVGLLSGLLIGKIL